MSVQASRSGAGDFDFFIGRWRVHHRRLNERLAGCKDWTEFDGSCETRKILGGLGNWTTTSSISRATPTGP